MRPEGSLRTQLKTIPSPGTVGVLGVPLALTDYELTLDWIEEMIAHRERGYECVCNVHTVMWSGEDDELRAAVAGSSMNVPDGQPLVWAINGLGHPLGGRVYGPELMARACARAAHREQRFYLYGGRNQGALVQLALNLRQRYPGVKIVGGYSPRTVRSPKRSRTRSQRRSTILVPTWCGSASAYPSRRNGWPGCVRALMRRC
jgi:UDP-N-acetyl-D-mannosaminuronic acid transferase (WecB/TagA/CpsF family)